MKRQVLGATVACLVCSLTAIGSENDVIESFRQAGARITLNAEGHATKLFSSPEKPHSLEVLQSIGELAFLQELALNAPQAGDSDWGFLNRLPELKKLTIWHCKSISSLEPFNHLPIEALTVGGCMGLRDFHRDNPAGQRDGVLRLQGLPNLTSLNLYHYPLVPGDAQIRHIVGQFPKLEELKTDFQVPRGAEAELTPTGLGLLAALPLKTLHIENVERFTPAHFATLADIQTLEALLIDARRSDTDPSPHLEALRHAAPDLEVVTALKGSDAPPRRSKR